MSDVKRLPCPFCGSEPVLTKMSYGREYRPCVSCGNMDCPIGPYTDGFVSNEEAVAAWNSRPDHARIVAEKDAEIKRLREALEKARKCLTELYPSEPCQAEHATEYYVVNGVINAADAALNPPQQKIAELEAQRSSK